MKLTASVRVKAQRKRMVLCYAGRRWKDLVSDGNGNLRGKASICA